ncbi:M20 family metallopeptidase [Moorella naiadis]|uniref:M20 metallopeptidase family protein n=1 Tax=Moorella naiadis (nom. illeg.) TaxID=3093670 RepID=UPI003D9C7DB1
MIKDQTQSLFPQVCSWRRQLHRNPERSGAEVNTVAFIADLLDGQDLEIRRINGGYGLVAVVRGVSGPTIALRADIDAIPVQEKAEVDFASTVDGLSHTCGHDVHTAVMLGAARYFAKRRKSLVGNIVFIFQPEEETNLGAQKMLEAGCLKDPVVDCILGFHVLPEYRVGSVAISSGPLMAGESNFDITIRGIGCHGSTPYNGADAIAAAATLVTNLYTALNRRLNAMDPVALTVGEISGGRAPNVVADSAVLRGTARSISNQSDRLIERILKETAASAATAFGVEINVEYRREVPPLVNHADVAKLAKKILAADLPDLEVVEARPIMASDDFAFYLQGVPGLFFFLGISSGKEAAYPLHHSLFKVDEMALQHGLTAVIALTEGILCELRR